MEQGLFRPMNPRVVAELCHALVDGALHTCFLEHGGEDEEMAAEALKELKSLATETEKVELSAMLSGEHDLDNAIVEIHPGAGGTESQDWAEMLMRMYLRWAERRGFKSEVVDLQPGDRRRLKPLHLVRDVRIRRVINLT